MAESEPLRGEFWVPADPTRRVTGEYVHLHGDPQVTVDGPLVNDPRVHFWANGASLSASPEHSVAAFLPITIHGELESGDIVTLLDGQNYGGHWPFGQPVYRAHAGVLGAHVDENQHYSAIRFRLGHPYWLGHLANATPVVVADDGSTLSVDVDGDEGNRLVYVAAAPASFRQLEMRVITACRVLAELALDLQIDARSVDLRVGSGPWLPVLGGAFNEDPGAFDPDTLLLRHELTLERFAAWIVLNDRLDGLGAAVARKQKATLQVLAPVVASLLEGLHRRLPYEQSKFPGVPKAALKRIRGAASDGAREQAEIEGLNADQAANSLNFFGEVSFRDRVKTVIADVCASVPEITESVPNLADLLTTTRHELAHHLVPDDAKEPFESRVLRWIVVSTVTPWLLRCLLLIHAGIDREVLHNRLLMSQRFGLFCANTAQHVRELDQLRANEERGASPL